jgi:cell division protein FtsL
MSGIDFEYAIRKDVRNNPIVREMDVARQRQFWRSVAIGAVLVAVLLFSAWQKFELAQHAHATQRLHSAMADEQEANRRLRLERESLRSPGRIEPLARQMNLVPPSGAEAIVIHRVVPPPAPDKSVVAAR